MMFIADYSVHLQLVIVNGLDENKIIIKLEIIKVIGPLQIGFTNAQQMRMVFSNNLFNLMYFINQLSFIPLFCLFPFLALTNLFLFLLDNLFVSRDWEVAGYQIVEHEVEESD
jgi:hypothetical protein